MTARIFEGLRVVEFGGGAAGPVSTRYFADYGATVIRVESKHRPDFLRTLTLRPDTKGGLDASQDYTEATSDLYVAALVEVGLLLFVVTILVNMGARLMVWKVKRP